MHFYALIGGITAVMSWVTDAGVAVQAGGITFVVGSTVFYTSILLGVMWLDVLLFATGAFAGTPVYLSIMKGTFISRLIMTLVAFPFLYIYLFWQNTKTGIAIENRPVLAILKQVAEIEKALTSARNEIEKRKKQNRFCAPLPSALLKQTEVNRRRMCNSDRMEKNS